ncbi:hypothetical protein [Thiomicrorhabdus sp.]|uniref:hypothetical protein n=1 Tax=Thiomicrorhabdus sp. TaxID=2039724 RepID=UPI002AA64039|nr:hypothetical protein [Thiomicrorhabdus sp.]
MTINQAKIQINKLKAIGLLIFAGLVIYLAASMLIASLYNIQSNLFLNDWQNKKTTPNDQAWLAAKQASENAININPVNNAFLQENKGKILQWQTYSQPLQTVMPNEIAYTHYNRIANKQP